MFDRLRRDVARYFELESKDGHPGLLEKARIMVQSKQLHAQAVYRFGSWVNQNVTARPLRLPLKAVYHVLESTTHALWGIHIDDGADIGGGLYIGHSGGVLIGPAKLGEDCNIGHNVTIGRRSDGQGTGGCPTIGDGVWIGVGSVVFGAITVGDGASIAPLTVVGRNVAPRALVAGSPMQVLRSSYDNSAQIHGAHPKTQPPPPHDGPASSAPRGRSS